MAPAPETGRRLALLVATSDYNDPDLRQLRAPGHDAAELAQVLGDPRIGGFDVQVLSNAASGDVQEGIEDFCSDRRPDDQLMIYLSCHGVLDSYGRLYYATSNTRRQRLAATAVAASWLNERLEDCRARRQILILDCCHSGAFAKGAKGGTELALQHRFEPLGRGRVVLTASRSTEYSFEGSHASGEGVPSVFTHAIVHGLRTGDADRDRDGLITVTDLYQYLYDKVRAAEPRQTPELWTYGAEGSLLVAHSIRGAIIKPEPLPEDLRVILESPRRRVRETGVAELAELLDTAGPGLALAARHALQRIAEEDHPQVAALARIAAGAPAAGAADQVRRELVDRAHSEEHARQKAAREAEQKLRREAEDKARREARDFRAHPIAASAAEPPRRSAAEVTSRPRVRAALRYAARSDIGLLRESNEDSAYAGPHLLAIAGGMGGHAVGEVASAVAIAALAPLDTEPAGTDMLQALAEAIAGANADLNRIARSDRSTEGMSTTLTALLWSGEEVAMCHVGDSRAYLLRDGDFYQISHDHTLVQSLIDEGRLTPEAAASHPQRSHVTRALQSSAPAEPDLAMLSAKVGDRFLLCSDGLSDVVSDERLHQTLTQLTDLDEAVSQLIDLAIRSGGPDNITCVLADVIDLESGQKPTQDAVVLGALTTA